MRKALAIAAASLAAALCIPALAAPARLDPGQARHLLVRTGFAPTRAEVDAITGLDAAQAVDRLIGAARAAKPRNAPPAFTGGEPSPMPGRMAAQEDRQAARREQIAQGQELKAWWLREMIESPTPLAERMTLFWHGHFATSQRKVVSSRAMWRQHELLRAHALGRFGPLLHAVAKDPAMLAYLDGANNRRDAPNENFAREVMELFTLGEASQGGGYTEHDIREAARAFTGWSIDRTDFSFRFRPAFHDAGPKTVLGATGAFDGDAVLGVVLAQPAVSRFIASKLWKEFVSPVPESKELDRIAARFRESGLDTSVLLRELLMSDAFWAPANRGSLVKSPVELVVGTVRQLGVPLRDTMPLAAKSAQLGQNLLMPPNVKGWPGYTEWINAATLLERKRFAEQVFRTGFDAGDWLAGYGAHPDREPSPESKAAMEQALLAVPATRPVAMGTVGTQYVKAVAMDPAYQLK